MKAFIVKLLIIIGVIINTVYICIGQNNVASEINSNNNSINIPKLNLVPSEKKIEHVFHITVPKQDFNKLTKTENLDKNFLKEFVVTYNADTMNVRELELRGKSSMEFKRKSFSVKLDDKVAFKKNGDTTKLKKFNLISLSMDQNYFRNKVAFDLMNQLELFNLFYDYAEVIVNGQSQGIYMILQKPKNYAFKKEDADLMFRRDYMHEIKKSYCKGDDTCLAVECEKAFTRIYNEILKLKGENLYNELSEILDIEQYFKWMAFNFLIGNKDYTDEVFFYTNTNKDSIKFGIIPWDYDDIFFDFPREGYIIRFINFGDKLAFSSEDDLDFKIITDDYTYSKYLETLTNVMDEVSVDVLKETFERTYQELYPFYSRKDILKISKLDKYGKTDLKSLQLDMTDNFEKIVQKRDSSKNQIANTNQVKSNNNSNKTAGVSIRPK